jgi:hypothetical protein
MDDLIETKFSLEGAPKHAIRSVIQKLVMGAFETYWIV